MAEPLPLPTLSASVGGIRRKSIQHGTVNGYNRWRCRCDACREAKNRYVSEHGYNRRVGKVKERKDAADLAARHPCATPGCDTLVGRQATLCRPCADEQRRARYPLIQERWLAGATHREIADELSTTPEVIQVTPVRMRKAGWNVPKRGPGGRILEAAA